MPFVPIPNTARCELRFEQDGQQMANIFHVLKDEPLTVGDLNTIGGAFVDWWEQLLPLVSNSVTLREISLIDQTTANGIAILYNAGLPLIGGDGGARMPNGTSLAIKWSTGLAGRSFRGRTFHIGFTETQCVGNEVEPLHLANLIPAYQFLLTTMTGAGYSLAVASRFANGAPRPTGIATPILNASVADSTLDRQWKRMPGRGR